MSDTTNENPATSQVSGDESFEPKVVNEFQTAPRGEARIAGIDIAAIDARLDECADFFSKHCDETDYRNLDWYLQRSQLRFAAGDDIFEVIDDMFMAARCLHERHAMHLELKPPEMFMTRRIMPVELGIMSGMPMLTLEFSATFGLPLMMVICKTAPEDIMSEANLMTSYFRRDFCADFYEFAGLSAVVYAGVIAAIGRGFDDEATVALSTYAKARESLRGKPPASVLPKIRRYDSLNTALACLCNGDFDLIGGILAPVADWFQEENAKKAGDMWLSPSRYPVPKYYDSAILTILALAALRGKTIEFPNTGAIAAYNEFTRGLMEMPERRIEVPGLDEEARQILEQAGVDPDQLQNNGLVDNSFHDAKEESEARARALFEERQRQAQRAVAAKLAKEREEEESHLSIEPQKFVHETLKMSDDSIESDRRYFDMSDADDDAARRANEENDAALKDDEKPAKDFSNFFSGDESDADDRRSSDDELHIDAEAENAAKPAKDFSNFFGEDADTDDRRSSDDELHINAEAENEAKPAKDFSNFFGDDEDTDERRSSDDEIHLNAEEDSEKTQEQGKSFSNFFDDLDENAIRTVDEGTHEEVSPARSFSADFFSEEKPVSDLKMTLDEAPEPEKPVAVEKTEPVAVKSVYELAKDARKASSVEDAFADVQTRDFSKLFEDDAPTAGYGLKMTLDEAPEPVKPASEAPKAASKVKKDDVHSRAAQAALEERDAQIRELEEEQARKREAAFASQQLVLTEDGEIDFSRLDKAPGTAFDDVKVKTISLEDARDAQIRELEEEQARKKAAEEAAREQNKLKLELDDDDEAPAIRESHQERVARLISERQDAERDRALREREEAMRELEELKQQEPQKPAVEQLKLTLDEPEDPDEKVEKVAPDDLVIKGFSYSELDMIHDNTAVREELEEDFDLHAAVAQKEFEEKQAQKEKPAAPPQPAADDIDDLIDFSALKGGEKSPE